LLAGERHGGLLGVDTCAKGGQIGSRRQRGLLQLLGRRDRVDESQAARRWRQNRNSLPPQQGIDAGDGDPLRPIELDSLSLEIG